MHGDALDALAAHNVHDLARALLVESRSRVAVADVCLEVKLGRRHARADLRREGRERLVAVERREHVPQAGGDVGEQRRAVAEDNFAGSNVN